MIVRILAEGQYELSDDLAGRLDELDDALYSAIQSDDEAGYEAALQALLDAVRDGSPLDPATILPSDLTLPQEGTTIAEVRDLLASEPDVIERSEGA
jgi:hypothetical protein